MVSSRHLLRGRLLGAGVLSCVVLIGALSVAYADIDPASDVLLTQDVFVPYQPEVCSEVKDALREATRRSRAAGYPLKVALIGSPSDLGGAPQFFGNPGPYAKFLGHELALAGHGVSRNNRTFPVVVVMPQGWGLYLIDPRATRAVNAVKIPSAGDPTALAHAAIRALPRIAAAVGHPTSPVRIPPRCTHKGGGFPLFLVPVAVLVIGGLLVQLVLQWRRHAEPPTTP